MSRCILKSNRFLPECMVIGEIEYYSKNDMQINTKLFDQIVIKVVGENNSQQVQIKKIKKYYVHEKEFQKTMTQKNQTKCGKTKNK